MNIVNNFQEMVVPLKVVTVLGFLSPVIIASSIFTGEFGGHQFSELSLGSFSQLVEFLLVEASTIPLFVGSFLLMARLKISRFLIILGWSLICLSPLVFSSTREHLYMFFQELTVFSILGILLFSYLFFSKDVKNYFSNK